MPNQLKRDPTRTTLLRRQYVADMRRRFKKISKDIYTLVVTDDAFGLDESMPLQFNQQRQVWRFRTNTQKVQAYRKWLQDQVDAGLLAPVDGIPGKAWTSDYVESAYKKGMLRSYADIHKESLAIDASFYAGGREQFLLDAFSQGVSTRQIEMLYTRSFTELKGITDVMSQQMSRILATGLAHGRGPMLIARQLRQSVANITKQRAEVLARTEIIAAYAEGQLDALEMLGVEEVQADVEWSTAGDDRVCPLCDELEGVVMKVNEARGLIPRHPNCRCAWVPAFRSKLEPGQKRGAEKTKAIKKSIKAEGPKKKKRSFKEVRKRSVWTGKEII